MDNGYARFRQLNDEKNREAERRRYEELQASRENREAERRHRELVAATKSSSSMARENPHRRSRSSSPGLGGVLLLFAAGLLLFAISTIMGAHERRIAVREDPVSTDEPTEAHETKSDGSVRIPVMALPRTQTVEAATEAVTSAETTSNLEQQLKGPIFRALDTGERVEWNLEGMAGYVTVSAAAQTTDGTCRTAVIGSAKDISQASSVWCKRDNGDWARVN